MSDTKIVPQMTDQEYQNMIDHRKRVAEARMADADAINVANQQFAASESLKGDAVFHLDQHAINTKDK